jgi:hypothetical protein
VTYQISFSGGQGSAVSALLALEKDLDFNLIFADTLIEDEDLHRFSADVARACGKEIIHLQDGRTPWEVFIKQRFIGNSRKAKCSTDLKTKPFKKWLKKYAAPTDPLVLGMGWEEMDRIDRARARWEPRPVVSLLADFRVFRWQYDSILKRHGIKLPRLYRVGFEHNNCGGFCVKAGQQHFARLLAWNPGRYRFHEDEMERAMEAIGPTAKPFLKRTVGGETEYLTLRQFRQFIEGGGEAELDFAAGCGCFSEAA